MASVVDENGFRQINTQNGLSESEKVRITRVVEEAIKISEPAARADKATLDRAFKLVFSTDWAADTPPSVPVLHARSIHDTSIVVGTLNRDPNPRDLAQNNPEGMEAMGLTRPRKQVSTTKATSTATERAKGAVCHDACSSSPYWID